MMTRAFAAVVAALVIAAASARAQTPEALHSAALRGRVVADDTGQPLRNARIAPESGLRVAAVLSDAEGRFVIAGSTDSLEGTVSKTGYAATAATLTEGVEVRLTRGAVITGRVVDDRGLPVPAVSVVADVWPRSGERLTPRRAAIVEADDRGEYRLYGLPAGDYVVSIGSMRPGMTFTRLSFYPGVPLPSQAERVHVGPGDEIGGINLSLTYMADRPRNASGMIVPGADSRTNQAPPQLEPAPRGTIRGRVIGPDGLTLVHARVQLESSERLFSPDSTQADADGSYAFRDVSPGRYRISVLMPGYRQVVPGQRTPFDRGDLVTMGADRAEVRVDVVMRRGEAIVGRVVDEFGDPVENVAVTAAAIRVIAGRRQLVGAPRTAIRAGGRTDDRGRYRIAGVFPGEFVVAATVGQLEPAPPTIDLPGYSRTFYPATLAASEAATVEVSDGQDRLNVDVTLVRGGTARVAGRVIGAAGEPAAATVALSPSFRSGDVTVGARLTKADGTFSFADVPPGEYVLQASRPRLNPATEGEFTARFVTVNGVDANDLTLPMTGGSTISGRIEFEDGEPPSASDGFELSPIAGDPDDASLAGDPVARADIHDDWTFEMGGVNGSRRLRVVHAPDGWMVKSILAGGLDATDRPIRFGMTEQSLTDVRVVMTTRVTELEGVVTDEQGARFDDAAVVVFARDPELRYIRSRFVVSADVSRDARFTIRGLAPADYYVAAIDKRGPADVAGEIDNREFLESLVVAATRVTVGEGQRATVTLRVAR